MPRPLHKTGYPRYQLRDLTIGKFLAWRKKGAISTADMRLLNSLVAPLLSSLILASQYRRVNDTLIVISHNNK